MREKLCSSPTEVYLASVWVWSYLCTFGRSVRCDNNIHEYQGFTSGCFFILIIVLLEYFENLPQNVSHWYNLTITVTLFCLSKPACLFWHFCPTREFVTHMETSPLPVKGFKFFFYLCSALMASERWGFFSVPYLLWHGTFIIMVILLTHIAERLAMEL